MTALEAAVEVLRKEGKSLPVTRITELMLERGLWTTSGKTPWATVNARISSEIKSRGEQSRFVRIRPGVYDLKKTSSIVRPPESDDTAPAAQNRKLSFTDAAERVLRQNDGQQPLHYRVIAQRIMDLGLVATKGGTPADTLSARIGDEIRRRQKANQPQRFIRLGRGMIGLTNAEPKGVQGAIENEIPILEPSDQPQSLPEPKLSYTDAAEQILRQNDGQEPLHCREITQRILDLGLVATKSKTPSHTLSARIWDEIRRRDKSNKPQRFIRLGRGKVGLADAESGRNPKPSVDEDPTSGPSNPPQAVPEPKLSYTNAAEQILRQNDGQEPLHYREIARRLLDLGLVATKAVTPAHTLSAAISDEIRRRQEANQAQRFVRLGRGLIGLADAEPEGVRKAIDDENKRVRDALLDFLQSTDPVEFEHLVGELFNAMGAESVTVTPRSGDGGVDVRGTLLAGGAIPIQIAAQVKRWKHNVGSPVVNEIRGSLGLHDFGLVVTTGRFSPSARQAAQIKDRMPITLIDGDDLVNLMVEHEIWVSRQQHDLLTLATPGPDRTK